MAKGTITLSGSTVGTKMESLEVEQGATGAVAGAFKVDNNDTDKQAIVVEAANIDADVMDITMDAVTTAKGIDITADALTTGSALYIDSDSSSTGTRNIASIIQNHASASGSTTLYLQNDHATANALLAKGAVTVGVDDTGHDVKFFGATAGSYMLWDESTDDLILGGAAQIGIGTTAPAHPLDIAGAANLGLQVKNANGAYARLMPDSTGANADIRFDFEGGSGSETGIALIFRNGTSEKMRLTGAGKLGIGATAPDRMLEIEGSEAAIHLDSSANAFLQIDRGAADDIGQITYSTAGSSTWFAGMADSDSSGLAGSEFFIGEGSGGASDAHFVINDAGNVGLGSLSPAAKLDVAGVVAAGSLQGASASPADQQFSFASDGNWHTILSTAYTNVIVAASSN